MKKATDNHIHVHPRFWRFYDVFLYADQLGSFAKLAIELLEKKSITQEEEIQLELLNDILPKPEEISHTRLSRQLLKESGNKMKSIEVKRRASELKTLVNDLKSQLITGNKILNIENTIENTMHKHMPELYSAFLPEGSKLYCLMKKEKEIIYQWLYELSVNDFTGKIKYSDIAREIAGNFHGLSNVRIRDIITKAKK